jgi:hypothetical protein
MSKTRACYNCLHYTQHGLLMNVTAGPRCTKGLNPELENAPLASVRRDIESPVDEMASFCDSYLWAPEGYEKLRRISHKRLKEDPRYSTKDLSEKFVPYFERDQNVRIKVERGTNWTQTEFGYVGMSVGWLPMFLLVRSSRSKGSSVLLSDEWRILGVKNAKEKRYCML